MFSGGLLSSNLTRSLGKIRNRQKNQSKKQTGGENRSQVHKKNEKSLYECNLNWDEYDTRTKNSPNTKPTYTLEVKGKIQFASYAGCLLLFGVAILMTGSMVTHLYKKNVLGPIGIGVGIYAMMMAICWLLDNRDRSKKFFHIQDLYSKYATKKYEKHDKSVQVDHSRSNHETLNGHFIPSMPDGDKENNTNSTLTNEVERTSDATEEDEKRLHKHDENDFEKNSEELEKSSKRKIHPELIKRFSMQRLSYDITFQNKSSVKVTDC